MYIAMFLNIPGLGGGKFVAPSILSLYYVEDGDELQRRLL